MTDISHEELNAVKAVLAAGRRHGYGNLIAHLQTAWARHLMDGYGLNEAAARAGAGGSGYPFAMQDDILSKGQWDETGRAYR